MAQAIRVCPVQLQVNYGTTKFLRVLPSSHSDTGCSCWCVHVKCSELRETMGRTMAGLVVQCSIVQYGVHVHMLIYRPHIPTPGEPCVDIKIVSPQNRRH